MRQTVDKSRLGHILFLHIMIDLYWALYVHAYYYGHIWQTDIYILVINIIIYIKAVTYQPLVAPGT